MHPKLRAFLSIVTISGGGIAASGAAAPLCVNDVASAWAKEHIGSLPTTLEGVTTYSVVYQKAIMAALPPATQAAIWRDHASSFLTDTRLDAGQRAELVTIVGGFDSLFAKPSPEESRELSEKAVKVFGKAMAGEIFGTLSGPRAKMRGAGAGCDCSLESDYCDTITGPDGYCFPISVIPILACDASNYGCGHLWLQSCNGICIY
jgi:hypothetical protein